MAENVEDMQMRQVLVTVQFDGDTEFEWAGRVPASLDVARFLHACADSLTWGTTRPTNGRISANN